MPGVTAPFEWLFSPASQLAWFWFLAVAMAFNSAYALNIWDRATRVPGGRLCATVLIGTLFVAGTYADALASKQFSMRDLMLLAFVAAHGWTADEVLEHLIRAAGRQRGAAGSPPG